MFWIKHWHIRIYVGLIIASICGICIQTNWSYIASSIIFFYVITIYNMVLEKWRQLNVLHENYIKKENIPYIVWFVIYFSFLFVAKLFVSFYISTYTTFFEAHFQIMCGVYGMMSGFFAYLYATYNTKTPVH